MKRLLWLDLVKFIAIILVIIGHTPLPSNLIKIIFSVNVPLFFVVAGYLFKYQEPKKLLLKNIKSLLVPYIFTCSTILILKIVSKMVFLPFIKINMPLKKIILASIWALGTPYKFNKITIPLIGAIWFLVAMFLANQLFNLSLKNRKLKSIIILTILYTLAGFMLANYFKIKLPFSAHAALIAQPFYLFGYLLKIYQLKFTNLLPTLGLNIVWLIASNLTYFWVNTAEAKYPLIAIIASINGSYVISYYAYNLAKTKYNYLLKTPLFRSTLLILCVHYFDLHYVIIGPYLYKRWGLYILIIYRLIVALGISELIIILKYYFKKNKSSITRAFK